MDVNVFWHPYRPGLQRDSGVLMRMQAVAPQGTCVQSSVYRLALPAKGKSASLFIVSLELINFVKLS